MIPNAAVPETGAAFGITNWTGENAAVVRQQLRENQQRGRLRANEHHFQTFQSIVLRIQGIARVSAWSALSKLLVVPAARDIPRC